MLGMSICDICASTAWFFSTWLEPVGSAIGAVGTQATCSLQGFFVQLDVTTIFYSGTLSLYYLLILVYKWENERFAKIEPFLHLNAWTWGLGTAIAGLPLKLFNPAGWSCFIAPNPWGCTPSWGTGDEEPNCRRGDNAHYYLWLFFYGPLWTVILLVTFCMIWVYWSVLEEEKQIVDDATEDQNETKPKKVAFTTNCQSRWVIRLFFLLHVDYTHHRGNQFSWGQGHYRSARFLISYVHTSAGIPQPCNL